MNKTTQTWHTHLGFFYIKDGQSKKVCTVKCVINGGLVTVSVWGKSGNKYVRNVYFAKTTAGKKKDSKVGKPYNQRVFDAYIQEGNIIRSKL